MRIVIASDIFDRSERALFCGLARSGFDVQLLCPAGADGLDDVAAAGVKTIPLTVRHRLDGKAVRTIRNLVQRDRPELLYAVTNATLAVSLRAVKGTRTRVVGYRGTMGHLSRLDPGSWMTYLHHRLSRIVCVADAVKRYLLTLGVPGYRLVTVPKGHDPDWYAPAARSALGEFGLGGDAFVIGFAGKVRPVKGVDVLLRAVRLLPPDSRVRVLIVGEVHHAAVNRLARDPLVRPRVCLAGPRPDAAALIGACDVGVMPSVAREGLPRGTVEAMAQGVPVLVTNVGGLPELVEDGRSGLVVPPRDPRALADAMVRLASEPALCRSLGEGARQRIESSFHIRQTIDRMAGLFRAVAR